MGQAIETVETWESGRNRASLDCGVPKSTLKDGISVRVVDGCMPPRPRPYLSPGEEKELLVLAGYGKDILNIVESVAIKKGVLDEISDRLWHRFLERQDTMSRR